MIRTIPHPFEILFGGGTGLCCALDGTLHAECMHGLFARDTRFLSSFRFTIGGHGFRVLARSRPGTSTAQWDMLNPQVRAPGYDLPEGCVHFKLRRRVAGALHDDLQVVGFVRRPTAVRLALQLDADFADIFQVKAESIPPRLNVLRVPSARGLLLRFTRGEFSRALHVAIEHAPCAVNHVGSQIIFDVVLEPGRAWTCCVNAVPEIDGTRIEFDGDPHAEELAREPVLTMFDVSCEAALQLAALRGRDDLERLAMPDAEGNLFVAAGAPWFLTLFGRDTLITALMASLGGTWHARGALAAHARLQARAYDAYRDAAPGKIAHEIRHGELAYLHAIPHTPYYGTHDAPALYVLALWNTFRFTGERALLERYLPHARAALAWCEQDGDLDHDGFLEYCTRSSAGYRNQGWKDAGDAILCEDGALAELPVGTIELQGYWYAARLALAEMLDVVGECGEAAQQRSSAAALQARVEAQFWMEDAQFYALARDGRKRLVRSIASNAGHLLWSGLISPERARKVAARLLAPDMWSGYGIRTLSADHRAYNPLSYQLGSIWPHDNALIAAGMMRYGLREQAALVFKAIVDSAAAFEQHRLPELFCGFGRDQGPPVPYDRANVPQAWAAAAPILALQSFTGLVPDAANGCFYLTPWLPEWLPQLELRGVELAGAPLELSLRRVGPRTQIVSVRHPTLELRDGTPLAPLWGRPWAEPDAVR